MAFSFGSVRKDDAPLIMGILNVTPDSFSDGGKYLTAENAVEHGVSMADDGADIIDIGGESTRPGAFEVSADEEMARLLPVVKGLRKRLPNQVISVDTRNAPVVKAVLEEGVNIINDISGGSDGNTLDLVGSFGAGIILMHMKGVPRTMQMKPTYENVVREVKGYLKKRIDAARQLGIPQNSITIDPGIGFGKTKEHNILILSELKKIIEIGYPVLIGISRKSLLQEIVGSEAINELIGAVCATTAFGVFVGAKIIRVHDVKPNRQAADVAWELKQKHMIWN